jgi:proline iminopeptidase
VGARNRVVAMAAAPFEAEVPGGLLRGFVAGDGERVLVLHGGPGLPWTYLRPLVDELAAGHRVAVYQQRGLAPSTAGAPYEVATQAEDVVAVLAALGWERAAVIGHSWGGHLLMHVLAARPGRITAALVVDTLGAVGDGGEAAFDDELLRRTPPQDVERVQHLERQAMAGAGSEADLAESMRLLWPAYFADPAAAPPAPELTLSVEAYAATFASLHAELPALAARIAGLEVPTLFLHGGGGPMPVSASSDSARVIGAAAGVEILERAGHFPWLELPGCVGEALDGLLRRAGEGSA